MIQEMQRWRALVNVAIAFLRRQLALEVTPLFTRHDFGGFRL
ncbi:predicted permeases [Zymobacter palmae]|uniref:Predicted permeases n=1 Tax=Zymobacter palmae TaxID=33074 RepID=A0A348HFW8_9GAMM|nr:predicted permeases [Zymobacter palmae]